MIPAVASRCEQRPPARRSGMSYASTISAAADADKRSTVSPTLLPQRVIAEAIMRRMPFEVQSPCFHWSPDSVRIRAHAAAIRNMLKRPDKRSRRAARSRAITPQRRRNRWRCRRDAAAPPSPRQTAAHIIAQEAAPSVAAARPPPQDALSMRQPRRRSHARYRRFSDTRAACGGLYAPGCYQPLRATRAEAMPPSTRQGCRPLIFIFD